MQELTDSAALLWQDIVTKMSHKYSYTKRCDLSLCSNSGSGTNCGLSRFLECFLCF